MSMVNLLGKRAVLFHTGCSSSVVDLLLLVRNALQLLLEGAALARVHLLVRERGRHAAQQAEPEREPDGEVGHPPVDLVEVVRGLVQHGAGHAHDAEDEHVVLVLQRAVVRDVVALPGRHGLELLAVLLLLAQELLHAAVLGLVHRQRLPVRQLGLGHAARHLDTVQLLAAISQEEMQNCYYPLPAQPALPAPADDDAPMQRLDQTRSSSDEMRRPFMQLGAVSGAADGEVRVWDLPRRKCVWNVYGHRGFVRGLAVTPDGNTFYSCSEDKTVKQWALRVKDEDDDVPTALATFTSKEPFLGIDHHWSQDMFATCGSKVQVWDPSRSTPTHEFAWGADSINSVHFNPAEASLLASTGSDRNITLYDIRVASSMRKIVMGMRSNALAWNPMEPMNFTVVRAVSSRNDFLVSAWGSSGGANATCATVLDAFFAGQRGPQPVHVRHAQDEPRDDGAQGPRFGSVRHFDSGTVVERCAGV
ncbi:hypothetical protein ON010_g1332 [Phytophthora cinnamomi]|nr:hypothetical protein ON010_g1332 [Phytophthora cinnamomi]